MMKGHVQRQSCDKINSQAKKNSKAIFQYKIKHVEFVYKDLWTHYSIELTAY